MNVAEVRALKDEQLEERITDLRQELFNLRFQVATFKNPSPARFKEIKKTIARLKTIQRERALERQAAIKQG